MVDGGSDGTWFIVEIVRGSLGSRSTSTETVQRDDGTVEQRETTTEHHNDPA